MRSGVTKAENATGLDSSSGVDTRTGLLRPPRLQLVDAPIPREGRVGDRLRAARLNKSMALDDAAKTLKLKPEYIAAMEAMSIKRLPKGLASFYVRDYARILGMDVAATVIDFNEQCGAISQRIEQEHAIQKLDRPNRNHSMLAGFAILSVCLIAAGAFAFSVIGTESADPNIDAFGEPIIAFNGASEPLVERPGILAADTAQNLDVSILATRRSWIEVRGADGTVFIARQMAPGETYKPRVGAGWTVTARDGGAFVWQIDGTAYQSFAADGTPVYSMRLDQAVDDVRKTLAAQATASIGASPATN